MNYNAIVYALGALLLGAVGIWFHDFAMQWQPVPASVGARVALAYASGAILVVGGGAILTGKAVRPGAWILALFFGFWVVALHIPAALHGWKHIGAWNGPAELTFATAGGLALAASTSGALRPTLLLIARFAAGVSAIVFGFAHFNYAEFTASMVPGWIPYKLFWAYATGAGHLAAGLAIVSGVRGRLAATLLACMMGSFVVLLHLPRVIAHPELHVEWIMLAVSSTLTGSAWLIRKYVF